jgi:hypothetical protein
MAADLDRDFLAELMYGQGVHDAAVISCNNEEVMKADPMLVTIGSLESQ